MKLPNKTAGLFFSFAVFVVGCSSPISISSSPKPSNGPIAQEINNLINNPEVDATTKQLLEDGEVSAMDLADAQNTFKQCLLKNGVEAEVKDDGSIISSNDPETDKQIEKCRVSSGALALQMILNDQKKNPDDVNLIEYELKCLIKYDIYPAGTLVADYEYDLGKVDGQMHGPVLMINYTPGGDLISQDEEGNAKISKLPTPDRVATEKEKEQYMACVRNPLELDLDE